jgi:hypothetical protein
MAVSLLYTSVPNDCRLIAANCFLFLMPDIGPLVVSASAVRMYINYTINSFYVASPNYLFII